MPHSNKEETAPRHQSRTTQILCKCFDDGDGRVTVASMWYIVWRVSFVIVVTVMVVAAWVYGAWHWRSCFDDGLQGNCAAYCVFTTCMLGIIALYYLLRQVGRIEVAKCNEQEAVSESK